MQIEGEQATRTVREQEQDRRCRAHGYQGDSKSHTVRGRQALDAVHFRSILSLQRRDPTHGASAAGIHTQGTHLIPRVYRHWNARRHVGRNLVCPTMHIPAPTHRGPLASLRPGRDKYLMTSI
jgi:hypothetical protein